MTTQTEGTAPAPQPTHHYILTLQAQTHPGSLRIDTFNAAITPPQGWTRQQVYKAIYSELTTEHPHLAGSNTIFFALEPNQL